MKSDRQVTTTIELEDETAYKFLYIYTYIGCYDIECNVNIHIFA